ncbi:hypothetical protein FA13DRAFT_1636544 [Coprinellus micaceus]|uniref:Uncharacterized protein n=1 Tax=Coprinellus micaceus TaxID=71717 RepID=A0A4Y7SXV5_COPMI|nr:hypothetical protein FA13DRAFT_1636544 [Coprinellus micaceus]
MDFLKKAAESALENSNANKNENNNSNNSGINTGNNVVDGLLGKVTDAVGASGQKAEQKEVPAVDLVQERVFKQGSQDNESAAEQAKDKVIADTIRSGYKTVSGKEFPDIGSASTAFSSFAK